MALLLLSCLIFTIIIGVTEAVFEVRFKLLYHDNGVHELLVRDNISETFASAIKDLRPIAPVTIVSGKYSGTCIFSSNFGTINRSLGLYLTYPGFSSCSNIDSSNNYTLLLTNFQLASDSFRLSTTVTRQIFNLHECCRVSVNQMNIFSKDTMVLPPPEDFDSHFKISDNSNPISQRPSFSTSSTLTFLSRNSIFFVAISFIVLMLISLGWLAFYYVERFRNAHTREYISVSFVFAVFLVFFTCIFH